MNVRCEGTIVLYHRNSIRDDTVGVFHHPASGKFVSTHTHDLHERYKIQLVNDIQDTRIWTKKESAEMQLKKIVK